jgi:hypothetical protein
LKPLEEVFQGLEKSAFRRRFRLQKRELDYLREKGLPEVMEHAREFIERRLAPARPERDGKQTPFRGHPVFVAQHATACCCRGCLQKWHGIPKGRELTMEEKNHVVDALARWLRRDFPVAGPPT